MSSVRRYPKRVVWTVLGEYVLAWEVRENETGMTRVVYLRVNASLDPISEMTFLSTGARGQERRLSLTSLEDGAVFASWDCFRMHRRATTLVPPRGAGACCRMESVCFRQASVRAPISCSAAPRQGRVAHCSTPLGRPASRWVDREGSLCALGRPWNSVQSHGTPRLHSEGAFAPSTTASRMLCQPSG
jgi:hypothetical protein